MPARYWELDFLRGAAVIGMIGFHFFYDLDFFRILSLPIQSGFWSLFARTVAATFIFLVGVSLTISYRRRRKELSGRELNLKYLRRGGKIFGYGLLITLMTWIFLPQAFIPFGVLHFIGVSIVLGYLLLKNGTGKVQILTLAVIFIFLGVLLKRSVFSFPWLLWLGFRPTNFYTLDYFPIFPWFGLILLGIYLGKKYYLAERRRFKIEEKSGLMINFFTFLGRNSLIIYFLHQPLLIGTILLLT